MRRWIADPHDLPGDVWREIQQLLLNRIVAIDKLRNALSDAILDAPA
jgi:hypothetical protein